MREDNRVCPICGKDEKNIIKHIIMLVPKDFILPTEYNIVSCKHCGFIFNDIAYSEVYEKYYSHYRGNTNFSIPSDFKYSIDKDKRENRHLKTASFIESVASLDKQSNILDVGCSYGATLIALKDKGYVNLIGLDLDRDSISYLHKSGITGMVGSIFSEDLIEFNGKFDLIILGHILEHLHEPRRAIDSIKKWLKPNGKIMIECPDLYQYPRTSPFPGFFAEYEHINHFSIISLMNLMIDFNLVAYRAGTIYALIEDFPCLYSLFEKTGCENALCRTQKDELYMKNSLIELNEKGRIVYDNIEKLNGAKIALWGAGQFLYSIMSHTKLNKCDVQYIVDKNADKWGKHYFGMEISSPQALKNFDGTIVICTTTAYKSVLNDIKEMGINNDVMVPFIEEGICK